MEPNGRRSRSRRRSHCQSCELSSKKMKRQKKMSRVFTIIAIFDIIWCLVIVACLITRIYNLHCSTSNSVDDLVNNFNTLQEKYRVLESKIQACCQELPKIQGQLQILEALAKSVEHGELGLSRNHNPVPLSRVKLYLSSSIPIRKNYPIMKNTTKFMNSSNSVRAQ